MAVQPARETPARASHSLRFIGSIISRSDAGWRDAEGAPEEDRAGAEGADGVDEAGVGPGDVQEARRDEIANAGDEEEGTGGEREPLRVRPILHSIGRTTPGDPKQGGYFERV